MLPRLQRVVVWNENAGHHNWLWECRTAEPRICSGGTAETSLRLQLWLLLHTKIRIFGHSSEGTLETNTPRLQHYLRLNRSATEALRSLRELMSGTTFTMRHIVDWGGGKVLRRGVKLKFEKFPIPVQQAPYNKL